MSSGGAASQYQAGTCNQRKVISFSKIDPVKKRTQMSKAQPMDRRKKRKSSMMRFIRSIGTKLKKNITDPKEQKAKRMVSHEKNSRED